MDAHELFPGIQKVASRVAAMFKEMGAEVRWVEGDAVAPGGPRLVELRVVLMPSEPGAPDWGLDSGVLGVAMFGKREQIAPPTVYIFFPNVVRTLGLGPSGRISLMTPRAHRDLSRVLSRVIVHEAVHAITLTTLHSSNDLMRENLSPSYLMRRRQPGLDARTRAAFRAGLRARLSRLEEERLALGTGGELPSADGDESLLKARSKPLDRRDSPAFQRGLTAVSSERDALTSGDRNSLLQVREPIEEEVQLCDSGSVVLDHNEPLTIGGDVVTCPIIQGPEPEIPFKK